MDEYLTYIANNNVAISAASLSFLGLVISGSKYQTGLFLVIVFIVQVRMILEEMKAGSQSVINTTLSLSEQTQQVVLILIGKLWYIMYTNKPALVTAGAVILHTYRDRYDQIRMLPLPLPSNEEESFNVYMAKCIVDAFKSQSEEPALLLHRCTTYQYLCDAAQTFYKRDMCERVRLRIQKSDDVHPYFDFAFTNEMTVLSFYLVHMDFDISSTFVCRILMSLLLRHVPIGSAYRRWLQEQYTAQGEVSPKIKKEYLVWRQIKFKKYTLDKFHAKYNELTNNYDDVADELARCNGDQECKKRVMQNAPDALEPQQNLLTQ